MNEPIPGDRLDLERKSQGVLLSRTKVLRDLDTCCNPRYRDILVAALADLEMQLERFEAAIGGLRTADGDEGQ